MRSVGAGTQLREIHDPASSSAIQIGHVDVEGVDALGGEDLLGLGAGGERGEVGRSGSFGWIVRFAVGLGPGD